jgi:hypothetical protein
MGMQSGYKYVGNEYYGANDAAWNLLGTEGNRTFETAVEFAEAFGAAPAVLVCLNSFHVHSGSDKTLLVGAADITTTGFNLQVTCYSDTSLKGVGVLWMAYDSAIAH